MTTKTYAYARVSTSEQNLNRQLDAFKAFGIDERNIICDKKSGKDLDRDGYKALKNTLLRSGDTLVIKSIDRLSRSKQDIKNELEYYKKAGIRIKVLDLPTTLIELDDNSKWVADMVNNILIEVLSSIAERERAYIKQRQDEGIASAKLRGQHMGRYKKSLPPEWDKYYTAWKKGEITAVQAFTSLKMKKTSFYNRVREIERPHHASKT